MSPLFIPVITQTISELFKFKTNSMRKEAIGATLVVAIVSVYNTVSEVCIESCTTSELFLAPSGLQYAAVILGVITMITHLNGKRKETLKAE